MRSTTNSTKGKRKMERLQEQHSLTRAYNGARRRHIGSANYNLAHPFTAVK
jgi:hypothetical protein